MVFGKRKSVDGLSNEPHLVIDDEENSSDGNEDQNQPTENSSQAVIQPNSKTKPLLSEVVTFGTTKGKNPRRSKPWSCKHYKGKYTSSYIRIHYHFFGAPAGKKSEIQYCQMLMNNRVEYERLRRKVQDAEKVEVSSSLKISTISKRHKPLPSNAIEDSFNTMERDVVDLKVIRGLYAIGIPFNVHQNPQFYEMVTAINKAPECYKAPSFERARTTLLDECKRTVEKDLSPVKDTWYTQGVSIVFNEWSNVKHQPLINAIAINNRRWMFMYADDFS